MSTFLALVFLTLWPFLILAAYALAESYDNYKFRKSVSIEAVSKTYGIPLNPTKES